MSHRVLNVSKLYESAKTLYDMVVVNGSTSADAIINKLDRSIDTMSVNWKGKDAGIRIQDVIFVRNDLVKLRNVLAQFASDSSKVATDYREIQNANGAGMESFSPISFDVRTNLSNYSDTSDTIDINENVLIAKNIIDEVNNDINMFNTIVSSKYDEILENWQAGPARDNAKLAFDEYKAKVNEYKQILMNVSSDINTALNNYRI